MGEKLSPEKFYRHLLDDLIPSQYYDPTDTLINETTVYQAKGKILTFIASSHTVNKEIAKAISKIYDYAKPEMILLEIPKNISIKGKTGYKKNANNLPEIGLILSISDKNNEKISGMDLSSTDITKILLKMHNVDKIKITIYWWFITIYNNIKRSKNLSKEQIYGLAKKELIWMFTASESPLSTYKSEFLLACNAYGQEPYQNNMDLLLQEMTNKYAEHKQLLELIDTGLNVPYPYQKRYKINKINSLIEAHRNYAMAIEIIRSMEKYEKVLAIAGSGHAMELRKPLGHAIKNKFKECKVKSWSQIL